MQKISNTILGRDHVLEEIGAGAMGVVYRATDPLLERDVAIKTIRIDVTAAEREEFKKRFFREAKSAARLNHPNIVTVYDAGETGDVAFIAMELLDGRDLRNYISLTERMPLESCAQIVADVARALHYAHAEGVIHRDVKPGNIILLNSGVVKLADFGIASLANSAATQTGQMFGTPKYMAPEQIAGRPADGRTDIFSLGIVLYQLITGVAPFDGDSFSSIMFRVMQEPAVAPSDLVPDLPAGFEYVVAKALAKDPNNRYQNAGQMDLDLRNLALSNDVQALPWGLGGVRKMADAPVGVQPLTNAWDATQVFDRPKVASIAQASQAAAKQAASGHLPDPLELAAQMDAEDAKRSEQVQLDDARAAKQTKDATTLAKQPAATAAAPMQAGLAKGVEERRKQESVDEAAKMGSLNANAKTVPLAADAKLAKQAVSASIASAESAKTVASASTATSAHKAAGAVHPSKPAPAKPAATAPTKAANASPVKRSKLKLFGTAVAGIAALAVGLYALQNSGGDGGGVATSGATSGVAAPTDVKAPNIAVSAPVTAALQAASAAASVASAASPVASGATVAVATQGAASATVDVASAASAAASSALPDGVVQDGRLSFAVAPWGEVYVNGQYRGVSPPLTELLLPPGSYQVQIRNSEFTPIEQKITIESGKRRRIAAKFK